MTEQILLNKQMASFEELTGYYANISSDHAYIHKGKAYTSIIDLGTISSVTRVGFTTPTVASGKYIHWRPLGTYSTSNSVVAKLTENDSFTGGSAVTIINRNRNMSSTVSTMQAFSSGVTSTPTGAVIDAASSGSTGGPSTRIGGSVGENEELLLLPNTSYVLTLTPGGSTGCILKLFWYEEDGYTAS